MLEPPVLNGVTIYELPNVNIKAVKLLLNLEKCLGIRHGRVDLQSIADDCTIGHQTLNPLQGKTCHLLGIEAGKGFAVPFPLVENRSPTQACLGTFQSEKLKLFLIVMNGNAPFLIMVRLVEIITHPGPGTTFDRFCHDPRSL